MPSLNIQRLSLKGYRCFEAIDIDFDERLTVLIASNGAGKTSILDALAVAFGPYVGAFDEGVGRHFESSDIRLSRVRTTATNEMEHTPDGIQLEATGWIPGSIMHQLGEPSVWKRSLAGPVRAKTTIRDAKELIDYGKHLQEAVRTRGTDVVLPLIAYYGTGRLWQRKKLTDGKLPGTSRTTGYSDCLDPASSYKAFVAWFRYWSMNALKAELEAHKAERDAEKTEFHNYIESLSKAVDICLEPSDWRGVAYSLAREQLVAHHDQHGELPVELLSDGIRNMIGMVADIAFRATKLNPQLGGGAARETPGIVLIDEVDMHLHPAWQQVVVRGLLTAFPHMQFIVTTHSPQVLSTVPAHSIRILGRRWDEESGKYHSVVEKPELQTEGIPSADVLAFAMNTDPTPNVEPARQLSEYKALVQQDLEESPEAQDLRRQLLEHFGAGHPALLECDRLIRLQRFKRKLPPRE
jgi:predicted ATP-binding protein involved in virulence